MRDPDVPWTHALTLVRRIVGDVSLTLVPDGDHRLSTPADIARMEAVLDTLLAEITAR